MESLLKGMEFSFEVKNVLELDSGDWLHNTINGPSLNCTLF